MRSGAYSTRFIIMKVRGSKCPAQGDIVTKWPAKTGWMSQRGEGGREGRKYRYILKNNRDFLYSCFTLSMPLTAPFLGKKLLVTMCGLSMIPAEANLDTETLIFTVF